MGDEAVPEKFMPRDREGEKEPLGTVYNVKFRAGTVDIIYEDGEKIEDIPVESLRRYVLLEKYGDQNDIETYVKLGNLVITHPRPGDDALKPRLCIVCCMKAKDVVDICYEDGTIVNDVKVSDIRVFEPLKKRPEPGTEKQEYIPMTKVKTGYTAIVPPRGEGKTRLGIVSRVDENDKGDQVSVSIGFPEEVLEHVALKDLRVLAPVPQTKKSKTNFKLGHLVLGKAPVLPAPTAEPAAES